MIVLGKYNDVIDFDGHLEFTGTPKQPYMVVKNIIDLPNDYTDITSIENVFKYGYKAKGDYLGVRKFIKELFYDTNKLWVNCNSIERDIVIDFSFYMDVNNPNASAEKIGHLMDTRGYSQVQSIDYLQTAYSKNHILMSESCKERANSIQLYKIIAKYLSDVDGLDFKNSTRTLLSDYKEDGIIGSGYSTLPIVGFIDFVKSTIGTIYEANGLLEKGYIMQNGDTDASNLITDITNLFIEDFNYPN